MSRRPDVFDLTVVFPAQDEATRLPQTLAALAHSAVCQSLNVEVLVVDDGSRDDTAGRARQVEGPFTLRVLRLEGRKGVGDAVRAGMLAARGERVLLCDADGPVPFADLRSLWEALDHGFDLAVGSRRLGVIEAPQPPHRILMGRIWGRLARTLAPTGVYDTQCGFKLFSRDAARTLFTASRTNSFSFHVEVILLAFQRGYGVVEVPVRWRDKPGSKIRIVRDSLAMALELLPMRSLRQGRGSVARLSMKLPISWPEPARSQPLESRR